MVTDRERVRNSLAPPPAADPDPPFYGDRPGDKADRRQLVAEMRAHDKAHQATYERARRGGALQEGDDPDVHAAGAEEHARAQRGDPGPSSGPRTRRSTGTGGLFRRAARAAQPANTAGGVLLGGVGYALGLAFIREGPGGPVRWLSAKFLNKVRPGPSFGGPGAAGQVVTNTNAPPRAG